MPVPVHGETLAVVYADDSGQSKAECARPSDRAKYAEVLRRYAIPCLAKHAPKIRANWNGTSKRFLKEVGHVLGAIPAASSGANS